MKETGKQRIAAELMSQREINYVFRQKGMVGIFDFSGDLSEESEDQLKLLLMRAIHGTERAVLNFKEVQAISETCLKLISRAYWTSIRMKAPLIITSMPDDWMSYLHRSRSSRNLLGQSERFGRSGEAVRY